MTDNAFERQPIDLAVHAFVVTNVHDRVGLAEVPEDLTAPYGVLWPNGGQTWGAGLEGWASDADLHYRFNAVGTRHDQVQALADRFRVAFCGREDHEYVQPLVIAGFEVMDRSPLEPLGTPDRIGDDFQISDRYLLKVSRA